MAKGRLAHQERLADMQAFGKDVGKRASFKCEWCEGKENLRLWDYQPDQPPNMDTLALLCERCRDLANGRNAEANELHGIRNALWSNVPAVAEGAAVVLSQCKEAWVREAIDESFIDDSVKLAILKRCT